jgi:nucleoside-diphosphate-sugar epimerase
VRIGPPQTLAGSRVAVTGAGGFIGSHLTSRLTTAGASPLLLGPPPKREAPVTAPGADAWLPDALGAGRDRLAAALASCDALVHLAYVPPPGGGTLARLRSELERNVSTTAHLLEAAAAGGVPFVAFASTAAIYPAADLNREDGPLAPRTPYAVAKLVQEQLVRGWAADTQRPAAVLRLTTVYGPGETVRRAIPRFITATLQGLPIPMDGDGAQLFAPVFVDDVAAAFQTAVELRAGGTFNVGGEPRPVHEVADLVVRLCGARPDLGESRKAERRLVPLCDTSRAASVLGVRQTALEVGLAEEIHWLRHQELAVPSRAGGGIQCA